MFFLVYVHASCFSVLSVLISLPSSAVAGSDNQSVLLRISIVAPRSIGIMMMMMMIRAGSGRGGGGGGGVPGFRTPPAQNVLPPGFLFCFVPAFFPFSCVCSIQLDYNNEQGKPRWIF